MLAGYLNGRVRTASSGFGYWNSEPEPELSIRSGCRTKPENHFMLRTAFEPRSFYPATFSDCHKTDTDISSSLSSGSGSFVWPFRVFILYRLFTLTLSDFSKFFSHFFSTSFFLCFVELSTRLHQLVFVCCMELSISLH